MKRSRRCECDKQRRNSGTPTHLGPASKAPTPKRVRHSGLRRTRYRGLVTRGAITLSEPSWPPITLTSSE